MTMMMPIRISRNWLGYRIANVAQAETVQLGTLGRSALGDNCRFDNWGNRLILLGSLDELMGMDPEERRWLLGE